MACKDEFIKKVAIIAEQCQIYNNGMVALVETPSNQAGRNLEEKQGALRNEIEQKADSANQALAKKADEVAQQAELRYIAVWTLG